MWWSLCAASDSVAPVIRMRTTVATVAAAVLAAVLVGGVATPATSQTTAETLGGGTLRVALSRWAPAAPTWTMDLDPQTQYWTGGWALLQCCLVRTLMGYPDVPISDGGGDLLPDLASDFPTVSSDGLTWTFHLKQGVYYAPPLGNVEITAPDIVRAIERVAAYPDRVEGSYAAAYYSPIEGFERIAHGAPGSISGLSTPDPYTLEVDLKQPVGDLGERFSVPASAPIARYGDRPLGIAQGYDAHEFGPHAVATGPYMFERSPQLDFSRPGEAAHALYSDADKRWVWVRNPSWDASTDPLRAALPDRIEFIVSTGDASGAKEVERHNDDVVRMVQEGTVDVAMTQTGGGATPEARASFGDASSGSIVDKETAAENLLGFRLVVPPFDDLHVRRAVSYALNRDAYVKASQGGVVAQSHLILDPFTENILFGYEPYVGSDLRAAGREMALSTYDRDHDGRCDMDVCRHVRFACTCTDADHALMRPLSALGMHVVFESLPSYGVDPSDDTIGLSTIAFGYDWQDAYSLVDQLSSTERLLMIGKTPTELRSYGHQGYRVPSLDAEITSCELLVGPSRAWCWAALDQREMVEVAALIPLGRKVAYWARGPNVASFGVNWSGQPMLDRMVLAPTS